ncbi:hypothetical protein F441_13291 [Phytophthora nicotianae CJ01A1]|uniref:Uncharacterized protein n=3 Tax=Phytophthora nicotianae TaxID=4792 RepID=W2YZF0_PHYNI|nr:hypothetical protein L917_12777 [Phytophthora nicotianae]ETP11175.1 hypothetical protein F441_13291 [Phytophthora nicotianae CJ01A1]ETP39329.1 hypothetical protein F442_13216 [Phytophthora nicotianae P10297]KUF85643.1 hypothetical protein AM587_10010557 [Phytophthora nicotianae]
MVTTSAADSAIPIQSGGVKHFNLTLEDLDATILLADADALLGFDDEEQLKLVLREEILDDADIESLTSGASENDEISKRKIRKATEAGRRRVYRRVQKREREELRRQARVLKEELSCVRQLKEKEKAMFDAAQTPIFWFWRSVASRLRRERLQAEEEQRALMISVQVQTAYIRNLRGVIRKRESESSVQGCPNNKKQCIEKNERERLEAFIQELDENCASAHFRSVH